MRTGHRQHEGRRAAVAEVRDTRERGAHVHVVHVAAVLVAIPMELDRLGRVAARAHLPVARRGWRERVAREEGRRVGAMAAGGEGGGSKGCDGDGAGSVGTAREAAATAAMAGGCRGCAPAPTTRTQSGWRRRSRRGCAARRLRVPPPRESSEARRWRRASWTS